MLINMSFNKLRSADALLFKWLFEVTQTRKKEKRRKVVIFEADNEIEGKRNTGNYEFSKVGCASKF